MLYPNPQQYTPLIDSHKDSTVLLDLSLLSRPHFQHYLAVRAQ